MTRMKLTEKPSIYHRDEKAIVIFPSKPYWFGATSEISQVLDAFDLRESGAIKTEISSRLHISAEETALIYKEVSSLLFNSGVLSIDDEIAGARVMEPHFQVSEVENVLVIATTNVCNLACPMCYAMAGRKANYEMTTSEICAIVDQVSNMSWDESSGITRIALTGGEIFSRPDAIELIEYVHGQGFAVQVNTNATLLTPNDISRLRVLDKLHMSISLDGSKPSTHEFIRGRGTFQVTTETIRTLTAAGICVAINMFLHAGNIHDLQNTLELSESLGVSGFNCLNMMNVGRGNFEKTKKHLLGVSLADYYRAVFEAIRNEPRFQKLMFNSTFANQIMGIAGGVKSNSCGIGTNRAVYVMPDGTLYPCADTALPVFSLGNLRTQKLKDLWENSPLLHKLRDLDVDTMNPLCSKCDVRYQCGGNCRGENFQNTGELTNPHFKCQEIHDSILELMWILTESPNLFRKKIDDFCQRVGVLPG